MKYIEYLALSGHLKKEGSSINEMIEETIGKPLNEATSDEIETSRASGKYSINSPRFAMIRTKLNNNAKKYLKQGKTDAIEKFMPEVLKSVKAITNKIVVLSNDGKSPEDIVNLLSKESKNVLKHQDKAMNYIDKAIDKLGNIYTKRIKSILEKSDLKEKNKLALEAYWELLNLQVQQRLIKHMVKTREDFVEKYIGEDSDLEEVVEKLSGKTDINKRLKDLKSQEDAKKQEIKNAEKEDDGEEFKLEKDQKFKIDGNIYTLREVGDDYVIAVDEKGEDHTVSKDKSPKDYDKFNKENLIKKKKSTEAEEK